MPIPQNKEELIAAINLNYEKLMLEINEIPFDLVNEKTLEGHAKGTFISVNNLLSYLIGWTDLVLKWNDRKTRNLDVDFPETGYKWNELGKLAQKFYIDYESLNFDELLTKLESSKSEILTLINSKTNKELYETHWYDKWTFGKMIQLNTSSPFKNAKDRVRKWKKKVC